MSEVKAMLGANFTELENGQTYYARVYTVNPEGYMQSEIGTQIGSAIPQDFPAEPSEYTLIGTYTSAQTWTAPEDGYFKVEVFGASGNGGKAAWSIYRYDDNDDPELVNFGTGGGGASGGYCCSIVKLNAGDTVVISSLDIGNVATLYFNSSVEVYPNILVASGGNGGNASSSQSGGASAGSAGIAGSVSGGNVDNIKGNNGSAGVARNRYGVNTATNGAVGGSAINGGNAGGTGGGYKRGGGVTNPTSGSSAFVKISRGNTNVVA